MRQAQQWLLTLLPAFPVLLLVLRLWQLSRQDMSTMLLLLQYVSPLGLLSALLIALVWAFPLGVLVFGVLGCLLRISAPNRFDPDRSLLAYATVRTPEWVFAAAVALAALTWQLRFLPALLMLTLWLVALRELHWHGDRPGRIMVVCRALPLLSAMLAYIWLMPAIREAISTGETVTAALLALPPAAAMVLTGPIPQRVAPAVIYTIAYLIAMVAPIVMGAVFLRVPVLPTVAVQVESTASEEADPHLQTGGDDAAGKDEPASKVEMVLGQVITVTDRMTVVLRQDGQVRFIPNGQVTAQTLCPEVAQEPLSVVKVHGWPVEETALDWLMPRQPVGKPDPRCLGRVDAGL